jgi:exodeoxyribonuclease-3
MRLISWNVNGIRAAIRNGFFDWFNSDDADIVCLQEVKAREEQIDGQSKNLNGYSVSWNAAEKAGYSGTASLSRIKPLNVEYGFGIKEFDSEGRIILQEFENFYLYNIYFPNGQRDQERLDYKMAFYDAYLEKAEQLRKTGKAVITCGDYNTAHKEIDLKNPKSNEETSGFLPIERAWMDKLVGAGYVDTFRMFHEEPEHYSWWTYRFGARKRNVGWRIDYFFIDEEHKSMVKDAFIMQQVMGSDHCPVGIELDV